MTQQEIKIRTVPRSNEALKPKDIAVSQKASAPEEKPSRRWIIYVGAVTFSLVMLMGLSQTHQQRKSGEQSLSSHKTRQTSGIKDRISQHTQEVKAREDFMRKRIQLENKSLSGQGQRNEVNLGDDSFVSRLGVQMDQEDSGERIYRDLNLNRSASGEMTPDERINARLATRKWLNEEERSERIQFIRNYILAAQERGYELEIDENLTVVGAHKLSGIKKVSIDQILNRMAQQGL